VILGINRINRRSADLEATDALLWSRKINDDAVGTSQGGPEEQAPLHGLLPIQRDGERQVVSNRCKGGRPLPGERFRDTTIDGIG